MPRTRAQKDSENRRRRKKRLLKHMKREDLEWVYYQRLKEYIPFADACQAVNIHDLVAALHDGRQPGSVIALERGLDSTLAGIGAAAVMNVKDPEPDEEEEEEVTENRLEDMEPTEPGDLLQYPVFEAGQVVFKRCSYQWWHHKYIMNRCSPNERDVLLKAIVKRYPNGSRTTKEEAARIEAGEEEIDLFAPEIKS